MPAVAPALCRAAEHLLLLSLVAILTPLPRESTANSGAVVLLINVFVQCRYISKLFLAFCRGLLHRAIQQGPLAEVTSRGKKSIKNILPNKNYVNIRLEGSSVEHQNKRT